MKYLIPFTLVGIGLLLIPKKLSLKEVAARFGWENINNVMRLINDGDIIAHKKNNGELYVLKKDLDAFFEQKRKKNILL